MKQFPMTLILALAAVLATSAKAEPPTQGQLAELTKLIEAGHVTRVELDGFLRVNRPTWYTVKRRCDLRSAIEAGRFNEVHGRIVSASFLPPKGCVEGESVKVRLFSPGDLDKRGAIHNEDAILAMRKMGCKPADWSILLPFYEKYWNTIAIVGRQVASLSLNLSEDSYDLYCNMEVPPVLQLYQSETFRPKIGLMLAICGP